MGPRLLCSTLAFLLLAATAEGHNALRHRVLRKHRARAATGGAAPPPPLPPEDACASIGSGPLRESARPQFHFTPARFWMNDPNGLIYHDGEYHLFFQHNPKKSKPGHISWGHAVSSDLLHWQRLENAILEDKGGRIYSGSVVVDWKNTAGLQRRGHAPPLIAVFTYARKGAPFSQRMAVSHDNGRTWEKMATDVLPARVDGAHAKARDPRVQWHEASQRWLLLLWVRSDGFGLYSSKDLKTWKQLQLISFKGAYECPDMFQLPVAGEPQAEQYWVIIAADSTYVIGTFNGTQFNAVTAEQKVEHGVAYAGQTFGEEPNGRVVQMSWGTPPEEGAPTPDPYRGMPYRGMMSFPVELDLVRGPHGLKLRRRPVSELTSLRSGPQLFAQAPAGMLEAGSPLVANTTTDGSGLEVRLRVRPPKGVALRIRLLGAQLLLTTTEERDSSLELVPALPASEEHLSFTLSTDPAGAVELVILLDRTVVEIFDVLGGESMMNYVSLPCEDGRWLHNLELHAEGNEGMPVEKLEAFELKSAVAEGNATPS